MCKNLVSVKGDATNLKEFADQSVDMVFSNSVIEHLYTWENQQKWRKKCSGLANTILYKPTSIEPHWWSPFFSFFLKEYNIG